jgi:hypothetical protein
MPKFSPSPSTEVHAHLRKSDEDEHASRPSTPQPAPTAGRHQHRQQRDTLCSKKKKQRNTQHISSTKWISHDFETGSKTLAENNEREMKKFSKQNLWNISFVFAL